MQYLTLWRMQLASRLLHDGLQVLEVAEAVGPAHAIALAGCCGIAATVMLMGRELRPARRAERATELTR